MRIAGHEPLEPDPRLVAFVAERLAEVRARIERAGADPGRVRVVAVTKGFGPDAVVAAVAAGLTDVGENYAQELLSKWGSVGRAATWHFLGAIQRNKVARLAPYVDCWQGVSRVVEGEEIRRFRPGPDLTGATALGDARSSAASPSAVGADGAPLAAPSLLVEVDTTGRAGRGGCAPATVPVVVDGLRAAGCQVDGLMAVAPVGAAAARDAFATVARLGHELGLTELSMGMSGDFEEAVVAGATTVRLGTALFGARPPRRRLQQ